MKSVIIEGTSIAKAVEEGLKKAGMPQEFFIKILQEPLSGFLGFGSRKAKVALFFKKEDRSARLADVLSQDMYKDLFDNKNLQRQIEQQEKSNKSPEKQAQQSKQTQQIKDTPRRDHQKKPFEHRQRMPKRYPRKPSSESIGSTPSPSISNNEKKDVKPQNAPEQKKLGIRKLTGEPRQNRWRNKHNVAPKKPNSNEQ